MSLCAEAIASRRVSPEGQEGIRAFLEKREAVLAHRALRPMFRRILIANRGEIAVRVMRTCREMGIETVAVYSDADAGAAHVGDATHAERIGPASARESYLNIGAIIDAARRRRRSGASRATASCRRTPHSRRACVDAGLVFIGPPASAIQRMGSKIEARALMQRAGVPVVPGEAPDSTGRHGAHRRDRSRGIPCAAQAVIGRRRHRHADRSTQGGRGGRDSSRAPEAEAAFGDGTLYVERLVERPRHVEIQIFADDHEHVVSLFERECSLQRRQQKVIEESPSPALTPELRAAMGEAAVAAARACGYRNAGTIEFLLDESSARRRSISWK